jgi:TP901 family phage tail tape measure protein
MPELTTAWVTLTATTRGMEADIRRALQRVERDANINPRIDQSRFRSQADNAGRDFASRFNSASSRGMSSSGASVGKAFLGGLAGFLTGSGITNIAQSAAHTMVDQFRSIFETGLDFSRTLNNFQGVTRATTAEMAKMQAAARALGSDTTLAGASSSDAALAMTELAKAGFSVNEAITAARGTLELATAGQIDAAKAAEIQSNAMNAFGLNAESAAHTADLFANAAVASSADIPDLGLALQQVGGIAHGFGENLDDTIAALGIFANAGIKGSDAGTLLKTTLQSITDQGNPAQGAIEALNLQLYNFDTHQFVGFRELFRQLDEAKKRMSPEEFQAETNILFGSDAARAAMLGNADAFDEMLNKIEQVGGASDLASSQMQGLPGAVEAFKNSVEGIQLSVFDALGPTATDSLNQLVQWIGTHQPEIINFFTTVATASLDTGAAIARFSQVSLEVLGAFAESSAGLLGKVVDALGSGTREIGMLLLNVPGMKDIGASLVMAGAKAEVAGTGMQHLGDEARREADVLGTLAGGLENTSSKISDAGAKAEASAAQTRLYKESFAQLAGAVELVPGTKDIILKDNSPEVMQKLRDLGFTVTNLPDGRLTVRLEYRDQKGNLIDPSQLNAPVRAPAIPGDTYRGPGRAAGGSIFGPGTGTSDSVPIMASAGEHMWTAAEVKAVGGQANMYRLRALARKGAFRRFAGGGDIWALANVASDGDPFGSGGQRTRRRIIWWGGPDDPPIGHTPDMPQDILPIPGKPGQAPPNIFGGSPGEWPPNNDFPLPGDPRWIWRHNRRGVGGLGFRDGGAIEDLPTSPGDYVVTPENIMSALEFAQGVNGNPYQFGGTGPLYDCSGFMSTIYGILTGKPLPEGQRYFSTESDFTKLGFLKGYDPDSPFNIGVHHGGPGGGHTAGTLAGYNVESGGAAGFTQFGGSAAGANDPQFEEQYHLPGSLSSMYSQNGSWDAPSEKQVREAEERVRDADQRLAVQEQQLRELKADAKESQRLQAQADVDKAKREAADARADLEETKRGKPKEGTQRGSSASSGSGLGENLGQSIISGMLQTLGLDGSVFSNPLEWPNIKSLMAGLNFGGSLLKASLSEDETGSTTSMSGGGSIPGIGGLPNIADFIKPIGPGSTAPVGTPASGVGTGPAPGPAPAVVVQGNVGMDPRAFTQRVEGAQNQSWRKNMTSVRPS